MSGKTGHGHGDPAAGSSDAVDYGKVIGVGVASLAIFAISIVWASTIWHSGMDEAAAKGGRARAFDTHQTEIGIVDQVPFSGDKRLQTWRRERRVALETYGWVDKSKGIVHIPIEVAMEKVAAGARPPGAPR